MCATIRAIRTYRNRIQHCAGTTTQQNQQNPNNTTLRLLLLPVQQAMQFRFACNVNINPIVCYWNMYSISLHGVPPLCCTFSALFRFAVRTVFRCCCCCACLVCAFHSVHVYSVHVQSTCVLQSLIHRILQTQWEVFKAKRQSEGVFSSADRAKGTEPGAGRRIYGAVVWTTIVMRTTTRLPKTH